MLYVETLKVRNIFNFSTLKLVFLTKSCIFVIEYGLINYNY